MADAIAREAILISASELSALVAAKAPVVILDARYDVTRDDIRPAVETAHVPGAIYVDVTTEFAGPPSAAAGRRPLPDLAVLEHDARRWGIAADSVVVLYDENKNVQAARAWWVLRWAGVKEVRLLDGGFDAWVAAGLPVTKEVHTPPTGSVRLTGGHLPVIDADASAALARESVLVDARGADAYAGEDGKPATGHIPGALSAPAGRHLTADGHFKSPEALEELYAKLVVNGERPVGAYCGSGTAASHTIVALRLIGIEAALYPGSWSAWSTDPSRPVAKGAEPG